MLVAVPSLSYDEQVNIPLWCMSLTGARDRLTTWPEAVAMATPPEAHTVVAGWLGLVQVMV